MSEIVRAPTSDVLVLLSHIRHTTFSYELSVRIARGSEFEVTAVSYHDSSVDELDVPTDDVSIVTLGASSRFDLGAIRRLRALMTGGSHRIVHTHHNFVGSLGRLLAPRDVRIVDTEHANHADHYSLPQVLVNALTLPRADRVVANSRATLESLYSFERLLLPDERFRVIHNGVDLERIDRVLNEPANPYRIDDRRITTVGRLSRTKNQSTLLRAFAAIHGRFPNTRLTVIGDGPLRDELESLATALGVRDRVDFTGFLDRDDVYRTLAATDLYVQPSLSEGFCVAAVEAMAAGVPVVVSDIDAFHEVVGDAGSFADPTDPDAFAVRIGQLLADEPFRAASAERASARSRSEFSLEKTAAAYADLYAELLER